MEQNQLLLLKINVTKEKQERWQKQKKGKKKWLKRLGQEI